jgi:hypothetical protein
MPMNPRLLRPTASGFDPRRLPGMVGWWDATDGATLFDATSGGSLVAADGSVARWEDKSGNGRHLTQSDLNARPLRKAGVVNGRDVLRFDGVNDRMVSTVIYMGQFSLYSVYKRTGSNTNAFNNITFVLDIALAGQGNVGRLTQLTYNDTSGFSSTVRSGATGATGVSFTRNDNWNVHAVNAAVGGQHLYSLNGSANTASNTAAAFSGTPTLAVGSESFAPGPTFFFNGDAAELIVYSQGHSESQRLLVERYLKNKYATA